MQSVKDMCEANPPIFVSGTFDKSSVDSMALQNHICAIPDGMAWWLPPRAPPPRPKPYKRRLSHEISESGPALENEAPFVAQCFVFMRVCDQKQQIEPRDCRFCPRRQQGSEPVGSIFAGGVWVCGWPRWATEFAKITFVVWCVGGLVASAYPCAVCYRFNHHIPCVIPNCQQLGKIGPGWDFGGMRFSPPPPTGPTNIFSWQMPNH